MYSDVFNPHEIFARSYTLWDLNFEILWRNVRMMFESAKLRFKHLPCIVASQLPPFGEKDGPISMILNHLVLPSAAVAFSTLVMYIATGP